MDKTLGLSVVIGGVLGKGYFKTFKSVKEKTAALGQEWARTNRKLGATGDVIKYKNLLGQLRAKQTALGTSSKRLQTGINEVERRYKEAKRAAKGYGVQIGRVVAEHGRLQTALKHTERRQRAHAKQQEAARGLAAMRGRFLGLAGSAYAAGRLAGSAMAREEQGLYLRTVINAKDGDKDAAVARARSAAKAFARSSLASEEEVLNIEYALNSASFEEDTARAGAQLVHKLAKVTRGIPSQVGEIFGDVFNNMSASLEGAADEKMERIGNVLAKTQFKFAIRDFGQLGEGMKYIAASAASVKLPLEQTASIIGILNNSALKGSMAGTAFESALKNLGKASNELGFEIVRDEKGELDMLATLEQLKMQLDGMDTDERDTLLIKLFKTEGKRAIVPLIDKLDELKSAYAEVVEAGKSGLVDEEYQRFLESSSGQWTLFKQNIGMVGEVFASTLLPPLNMALSRMGKFAGWVATGIERFPIIGHVIGAIGGAFVLMGGAMAVAKAIAWGFHKFMASNLVSALVGATLKLRAFNATALITATRARTLAIGSAIKGFGSALVAFASRAVPVAIGALKALTVAVMSNPIGLIIGGIALAAGLIITFWQPIKGFFSALWAGVSNVFTTVWRGFKTLLSFTPLGLIASAWNPIKGFFSGLWDGVIERARAALDWLLGKFQAVTGVIGDTWKTLTGWFGDDDDSATDSARPGMIGKTWKSVTGWFGGDRQADGEQPGQIGNVLPGVKPVALAASIAAAPVVAQAPDPDIAWPTPAPAAPARVVQHFNFNIEIHQQPGQSSRELADDIVRAQNENLRGALYDGVDE